MAPPEYPYQPRAHDPGKTAFVMCDTGQPVSFGELEARANQGAHVLREAGISRGDHIAILLENRREYLEVCFAADRAGVYYTTVNTHMTASELAHILMDCGARLLITSARFADTLGKTLAEGMSGCPVYTVDAGRPSWRSWAETSAQFPNTPIEDEAQGLDMLYSSGTTGQPKGIKWPLNDAPPGGRTMLVSLLTGLFGYGAATRYLCPAPLYHAAPLRHTMVTIKTGGTAYVMDQFDAETALALIARHRITHSQWVPTMFIRLLKLPQPLRAGYDVSSLKMAVHAAAPCPIDVKRQMIDWWGEIIHEYYAGTENNGFTAITAAEWLRHPGSVGQAKLGTLHICDARGAELPQGAEGEVYFENGQQFSYHNDRAKTAACTNAQGWTTLGDIGRLDPEGYLYLTDRKSFMIISGGVNISPQEAEDALLGHPQVMDAAVIGVPNAEFGEEVKALVQLITPQAASPELADHLIAHCRARLAKLKCPRSIEFRETLPRSATGKLYKRKLRDEFWPTREG